MDSMLSKIFESVLNQGLSLTFSCIAVWFLWQKIKECEADRTKLWERLLSIAEHNENK
jgi:hypothetical protein